jgi:hypothetical protein
MRGFHDLLLRQKPSSLFIHNVGMKLNLNASLMMRSMYLRLVGGCGTPSWYCALPWLTFPDILDGYAIGSPSTWCQLNGPSAQCRPDHTYGGCCILLVSPVPGRKLNIFLGGRPTDLLCWNSTHQPPPWCPGLLPLPLLPHPLLHAYNSLTWPLSLRRRFPVQHTLTLFPCLFS